VPFLFLVARLDFAAIGEEYLLRLALERQIVVGLAREVGFVVLKRVYLEILAERVRVVRGARSLPLDLKQDNAIAE
jgi:hypothetical protein